MNWALDLLAILAVVAAVAFLLRRRRSGCSDCAGAKQGAETRVTPAQLRASARRACDRG